MIGAALGAVGSTGTINGLKGSFLFLKSMDVPAVADTFAVDGCFCTGTGAGTDAGLDTGTDVDTGVGMGSLTAALG